MTPAMLTTLNNLARQIDAFDDDIRLHSAPRADRDLCLSLYAQRHAVSLRYVELALACGVTFNRVTEAAPDRGARLVSVRYEG